MRLVCPVSGSRFCFGAQGLRLLLELAGAHRRVPPAFCVPDALTLSLAVQYAGVLLISVASGEKRPL